MTTVALVKSLFPTGKVVLVEQGILNGFKAQAEVSVYLKFV